MKISVNIPVYDGRIPAQLASCLLAETLLAWTRGDLLQVRFLPACSNLAMGRNQLVKQFLESDDDRLVFVDADVTFQPGELVRIAHHSVDFVGGVYRLKQEREQYPVAPLDEPVLPGPGQLVEVAAVPTGFLSLSRKVFEAFKEKHPGREYQIHGQPAYAYFQIPFKDGALYTEDAYFCREWKEAGGKIYLDPELSLTHWGESRAFPGHIGNWIRAHQTASATEGKATA